MGALSIATVVMFVPLLHSLAIAIPLSVIDIRERRLPNKLVLPNLAVAFVAVLVSMVLGEWQRGLLSLGISVLLLALGMVVNRLGWIGMGDVKLLTALSLSLSWFSAWNIPIVLGVSVLAVGVMMLLHCFSKTIRFGLTVPMGPWFLSVFAVLAGNILLTSL
jgi:leader peptidase (prepilin peptidase)/N-methyltransferase